MTIGYVAYIDESGCDGLKLLKPAPNGSSEWFVISGSLVSIKNDTLTLGWVKGILNDIGQLKHKDLHFKHLNHDKKLIACNRIAELPIRNFVVMSNKKT